MLSGMKKDMDVSIIIVNYHADKLIADTLDSISEKTNGVEYEVIIVDSDPRDDTQRFFNSLEGSKPMKYIPMDTNRGFGAANNEGFRHASGKYLFCLNPDTLLINNAIKILADYMDNHSDCGACGGNLFHEDMRPALSFRRILPGKFWEFSEAHHRHPERLLYGRNTKFNHSRHPLKVGYITGADLMLRADLIDKIGGFDPAFFMYFEETDLCFRIHKSGHSVMSVPDARIIHLEGRCIGTQPINYKKLEFYAKSRAIYYKKNLSVKKSDEAIKIYLNYLRKTASKPGHRGEEAHILRDYMLLEFPALR